MPPLHALALQGMMGALVIMLLSGGILNGLTPNLGDVKRNHQWYLEVSVGKWCGERNKPLGGCCPCPKR